MSVGRVEDGRKKPFPNYGGRVHFPPRKWRSPGVGVGAGSSEVSSWEGGFFFVPTVGERGFVTTKYIVRQMACIPLVLNFRLNSLIPRKSDKKELLLFSVRTTKT